MSNQVNHPQHYGGEDNPYEAIKVILAWGAGFCVGNALKYISRAGKKDPTKLIEDLEKSLFYLKYEIRHRKAHTTPQVPVPSLEMFPFEVSKAWDISTRLTAALYWIADAQWNYHIGASGLEEACQLIIEEINFLKEVTAHEAGQTVA